MIGLASLIGAIWLSTSRDQRDRQQADPALGIPQGSSPPVTPPIPIKSTFRPGAEVELIGPKEGMIVLCANEAIILDYRSKTRDSS